MMSFPNYNDAIESRLAEPYHAGRFWTPPFELMANKKTSQSNGETMREPFVTIDDLKQQAQALADGLTRLANYKHPLDVRRGVGLGEEVMDVRGKRDSRQLKAGSKTYFFDIEKTSEGKPYLKITESRFKGESEQRERSSVIVFPENAQEFAELVSEMIVKLG